MCKRLSVSLINIFCYGVLNGITNKAEVLSTPSHPTHCFFPRARMGVRDGRAGNEKFQALGFHQSE